MWTSLAVQWLRLLLSTQRVQSLVWELRAYMPCNQEIKKIKKKNQKYVFMDRMSYPELYEFGKARELSDYLFSMLKYSCGDAITIPLLEMRRCGCREAVM